MTSKIIVNNVGADVGIASVHFDSNIQRGSSNLHSTGLNVTDTFLHSTGLNVTSDSSINIGTGATISQPATNSLALGTNSNERLRIGPAGQIGLGGANYGTSGQTLTSGGPSSAATWSAIPAQLFSSYAIIADRKSYTTDGGSITANTWTVRDLNTEITDPDGIVSISSNQFILGAGTYLIKWRCPGNRCQEFNSALYNVSDSAYAAFGESAYSYSADGSTIYAVGMARVTISGTKTFDIRMICNTNVTATTGMGRGGATMGNFDSVGGLETYTTVEIYKEG